MRYIPPKNTRKNFSLLLCGLLLLFLLQTLSLFDIVKPTLCHFAFFFEAVFYTFVLAKFVLPTYTYALENNRFTITKTTGNKCVVECDIDVSNIKEILPYTEYKKQENKNIKCVYNYNANFISSSCQCLIFEYSGICEAVLFEPNKELINHILNVKENLSSI